MHSLEPSWSEEQVAAFRLSRHFLSDRSPAGAPAVAAAIGGFQAQVLSAADLQAWSRLERPDPAGLTAALWAERSLVRTWTLRGTLHVMAAADLPLVVGALDAPRRFDAVWLRAFKVTQEQMDSVLDLLPVALDGRCLTRRELAGEVGRLVGAELGDRLLSGWGEFLKPAARRGLIVQGPPRGQEATFVRTDQWLSGWAPQQPDAARRIWVRRYLAAYGPATPADYARWMGLRRLGPARAAFQQLEGELVQVQEGGRRAWLLAADEAALARAPAAPVRLLAAFDPYLLGHVDREHVIRRPYLPLVSRAAGWISAVVLAGGRAVATWTHRVERGSLRLEVAPFARLAPGVKSGVRAEAERLASLLGAPLALTYT